MRTIATILLAGSLAAAGCGGGEEPGGSPEEAEAAIEAVTADLINGDGEAACAHMTENAASLLVDSVPLQARDCPDAVDELSGQLDVLSEAQLEELRSFAPERVEVDGDSATATYGGEPPSAFPNLPLEGATIELVHENGQWLIDGLSL